MWTVPGRPPERAVDDCPQVGGPGRGSDPRDRALGRPTEATVSASNPIPPHRPSNLAPAELRQLAATMVRGAVPDVPARAIDAAVWAMFGSLGMTPREAAVVADFLWAAR